MKLGILTGEEFQRACLVCAHKLNTTVIRNSSWQKEDAPIVVMKRMIY
jgi:hypothetical protein